VKYKFERRLGLFPAGFDEDGQLYCNTAFGDYPIQITPGKADHKKGLFTGWTLLSFNKKSLASSSDAGHPPELAFDEGIRTYWSAASGKAGEFLQVDLGKPETVFAVQVNYAEHHAMLFGKQQNIFHQYIILESTDGRSWRKLIDKSKNRKDVPHDFDVLRVPVKTRFLKLVNIHIPGGYFAIGDFRIFGKADGAPPGPVKNFSVTRQPDRRNVRLHWDRANDAYAYNIYYGISPDKLYNCIMVINQDHVDFRGLNIDPTYYFSIEAIGETGVSTRSAMSHEQ